MSTYITLDEAKDHLRVDFSDDDTYIQLLCDMVEELVSQEIGASLASSGSALVDLEITTGVLPRNLVHAMYLMIGHFYNLREATIIGVQAYKIPYGFEFLIAPYRAYTIM